MFTKLSELDFQKVCKINLVFPDHSHLLFLHKDTLIENVIRTGTSPFYQENNLENVLICLFFGIYEGNNFRA